MGNNNLPLKGLFDVADLMNVDGHLSGYSRTMGSFGSCFNFYNLLQKVHEQSFQLQSDQS